MSESAPRRRLSDVARRAARSVARRTPGRRPRTQAPSLTVVVPVYNVERYLRECLDSVLAQTLDDLEVIAVDDGSTDGSPAVLAEYAARDPRLQVVTQPNGGLGAARNRGIELARGEFLTFCDSDDTLPPRAYEHLVRTLRRSGSDFVVGAARRVKHGRNRQVAWGETVHEFDRIATTIDEFPAALQDIVACNRVFRTDFWRDRIGVFEEGIAYEDHVPMLAAYVRADRFDVLARVTYFWRMREDQTSIGQQKADLQNLLDRVAVKQQAFEMLQAEATPATYDTWVGRCLDIDFPPFLRHALVGSPEYREVLASTYRTFLDRASERALRTVRHPRLVRAWLCAGRHWEELAEADAWFAARRPPVVRVEGDRLYAVPDLPASVTDLVPASAWALAESETALRTAIRSVRRDGTTLLVEGYALVPGLDTGGSPAPVEARLVGDDGEVELPVTMTPEPEIDQWVEDGVGHAQAGFVAGVDLAALHRPAGSAWQLRLRLRHGEIVRESGVHDAVSGSGAVQLRREVVELDGVPVRVEPTWDPAAGFRLALAPATVVVDELAAPAGSTISGRLSGTDATGRRIVARATSELAADDVVAGDGAFTLQLPDPELTWTLRTRHADQPPELVLWPGGTTTVGEPGSGQVVWQRAPDGVVQAVPDGRAVLVERIELRARSIVVEVSTVGVSPTELEGAVWRAQHVQLPVATVDVRSELATLTFPTTTTPPHGAAMVAPTGVYVLAVRTTDGRDLLATATDRFAVDTPWSQHDADLRLSLRLRKDRTVVADLGAPLDDQERTAAAQELLRRAHHRAGSGSRTPAVLLHATGHADGRRALAAALARSHPERERLWSVRDRSVPVPPGTTPVLVGSRRWYDALTDSSALWTSGDLPDYFRKGDGQRTLQTFVGFPVRPVGRSAWSAQGQSELAVELEVARRRQQWDAMVAPTEEVADLYRREFDFDGRILVTGHPRCDDLVTRDRASVRTEVLARLGVPEDQTVVLHVRASRNRATQALLRHSAAAELDLARLASGLGPGHVVLSVGIPHVPGPVEGAARVVDATTYPAMNDLLLTADAAVLDYTDLRFDWALTGRPAVFHVPDHDAYLAAVPAPLDFDSTAAGPQVHDTDAVIDAVRSRSTLQQEYADAVDGLNATFNALHDGHAADRVVAALLD